jgi:hypothetical protein
MSIQDSITSQYHAALEMLKQAVIQCPDALWDDRAYKNVFWQVAYHVLFYTHLYLQPTAQDFVPWAKHRDKAYRPEEAVGEAYRKEEMLAYLDVCREQVEAQVAALDPEAPSGFSWLHFNKLEVQFYNIRHLQHHTGELCERLGAKGEVEVGWVMMKPAG